MTRQLLLLAGLLAFVPPAGAETGMDEEIDYLLQAVAASGCTFIRNGKEAEAADAVDHLQMKRKRGKRYYSSTEEFIDRIASSSSWSGKPYLIACGDADPAPIRDWYLEALDEFRGRARVADTE